MRSTPRRVSPVWGGLRLAATYGKGTPGETLGETWEVWADNLTADGLRLGDVVDLPILVKLLDTREKLSVQVHPDDLAAARLEGAPNGKAEGWVVLHAEPGARIAYGLRAEMHADELRARALDGSLEDALDWREVHAGDVLDVPPGTIHAIGGGLTLYEIQQPSDLTYRLYDYGRGRELHLEKAVAVATRAPAGAVVAPRRLAPGREELLSNAAFTVERIELPALTAWDGPLPAAFTLVEGEAVIGTETVARGETVLVTAPVQLSGRAVLLVGLRGRV